jgi:L-lysine 6-transaminase
MRVVHPDNTLDTLEKYILVDGFHVVADQEKSHGSWIHDARGGKPYLDLYSQFASQALGWNHPALIANQHRFLPVLSCKMANSDMYTTQYAEFVETFASVTPDFKHYFFIDGGALAVENALKCAFDWKAKKIGLTMKDEVDVDFSIMHLKNAFHGRTGYTMSLTNTGFLKTGLFPQFNWPRIDADMNGLAQAEEVLKKDRRVAAIIAEPILGEGGDIHLTTQYLQGLRDLADKYEALLIFDEVQTGLGLTGKWWAYEHHDVKPDILCFGKKTQVCGMCANERVDEVEDNVFTTSGRINSTWGGNLVDMVRASIIIETIRDNDYVGHAACMGEHFLEGLKKIEGLSNVRGVGLMIAFDLESSEKRDEFVGKLQNDSVLPLKCGDKGVRFRPHLTITKEDIKFVVDRAWDAAASCV